MAKIVITEAIHPLGAELLKAAGHQVVEGWQMSKEEMLAQLSDAEGALVRILPITAEMTEDFPKLRIISKHGVGIDNFDLEDAAKKQITITTTPGANTQSVAEHAVALMMTLAKNIIPISQGYREKGFSVKTSVEGTELFGKTLGLIGCGAIGRRVAHMAAQGLDMRVLVYDPYIDTLPEGCERSDTLEQLLEESDCISLHCYLSDETRHMIDEAAFKRMKPGAVLINCARGPVVKEEALIQALESGRLVGAGLDVTEEEPLPPDHILFKLPGVIITPHYAPTTRDAAQAVARMAAENLIHFFRGEAVKGQVSP